MKLKTTVFLIGFSGSGQSTLGARLSEVLDVPFFDTDARIERETGRTISALFMEKKERGFRKIERDVITSLLAGHAEPKVVALGGGAFVPTENRRMVCDHGVVIYLQCSVNELYRRLNRISDRPLLEVKPRAGQTPRQARMERIKDLLNRRRETYRLADATVSTTNKSVKAVVEEILGKLEKFNADNPR